MERLHFSPSTISRRLRGKGRSSGVFGSNPIASLRGNRVFAIQENPGVSTWHLARHAHDATLQSHADMYGEGPGSRPRHSPHHNRHCVPVDVDGMFGSRESHLASILYPPDPATLGTGYPRITLFIYILRTPDPAKSASFQSQEHFIPVSTAFLFPPISFLLRRPTSVQRQDFHCLTSALCIPPYHLPTDMTILTPCSKTPAHQPIRSLQFSFSQVYSSPKHGLPHPTAPSLHNTYMLPSPLTRAGFQVKSRAYPSARAPAPSTASERRALRRIRRSRARGMEASRKLRVKWGGAPNGKSAQE